ncbi:hypothetical protein SERLADRAFT_449530 [Serpula lacrymans var. lacrymans S7.9]|uniref:Major facilitator superfamily (MFS) profile domain-containing protein n=1 Tax=Serpula lacrymans var. lacrymans (strain S7.9) TaxID=578457 RepID=F8NXW8_SERL9|nr:uncharacterized protein SERLADRAFT_449530 [Serpula lacrymans var. lacrymans S7.9]EGO24784.1 hypothetical protein SERLADRAFT_449530 [Serpula lacrymans var. lacrymans S7.9]
MAEVATMVEQIPSIILQPAESETRLPPPSPPQPPKRTPLPVLQLSILLLIQLAEPVTCTVIYPFVNHLVRQTGITKGDETKTGYFAGLIESLFYATEAITVLQWGRVSDRMGRKPILLVGLFGLTLSILSFGVSKSYWTLVLSRCAEGALNGNVGVAKSMMAEITDPSNMAQGFAFLPMVWAVGGTLGPIIGGMLSVPAERWPNSFGRSPFFVKYPYFLSCLIPACLSVSTFVLTLVCLKETVSNIARRKKRTIDHESPDALEVPDIPSRTTSRRSSFTLTTKPDPFGPAELDEKIEYSASEEAPSNVVIANKKPSAPPLRSLLVRRVLTPILNYAFIAFVDQCMTVLQPLMYSTPIALGGLSFSPFTIGIVMGVWGVINGCIQIFAFPALLKYLGPRKLYTAALASYFISIGAYPLMSFLAKQAGGVDGKVWAVLVFQLASIIVGFMGFGCIFIYVTDGAPSREALGATNGIAQTTASTMRALAPSAASSLFSLSLQRNLAGGTAVYWILMSIIIVDGPSEESQRSTGANSS